MKKTTTEKNNNPYNCSTNYFSHTCSVNSDYVEKILLREEEGTFVVFLPNSKQEVLTLVVRYLSNSLAFLHTVPIFPNFI